MKISSIVNPTESEAKIMNALENIFPEGKFSLKINKIIGVCSDPQTFKEKILTRDILHVLEKQFKKNLKNNHSTIQINKQAAVHGVLNIIEDEPTLGAIKVEITTNEFKELFDLT
jgi:predicted RNA binding protein with dsRBD fold (UPF0201 family)